MAAYHKFELDYFPLKCNFFKNDKIEIIRSKFGNDICIFYLMLLSNIYSKKGYYLKWNDDLPHLYKSKLMFNGTDEDILAMINFLCKTGLFDKNIFDKYSILTSESIQLQYIEIMYKFKRLKWICVKEIWLISFDILEANDKDFLKISKMNDAKILYSILTDNFINSELTTINSELTTINSELMPINSEFELQKEKRKKESIKNEIINVKNRNNKRMKVSEKENVKVKDKTESNNVISHTQIYFEFDFYFNFIKEKFNTIDSEWLKIRTQKWFNLRNPDWFDKYKNKIMNPEKDLIDWIYTDLQNYMDKNNGNKPNTNNSRSDAIITSGRSWTANDLLKN